MQLHNALVFPARASESGTDSEGRRIQLLLDDAEQPPEKALQIFSKSPDGDWTLHVEGRVVPGGALPEDGGPEDFMGLRSRLSPEGIADYYRAKSATGIDLGPSFRTLTRIWTGPGEALAQIELPDFVAGGGLDAHPLMLDGCFQVVGLARNMDGGADEPTYLPFGWERCWLARPLPSRIYCHVRMSQAPGAAESDSEPQPEVLTGELRIFDDAGDLIGGFGGYTVKRATRAALLSAVEGVSDLLYEVAWRERPLESGLIAADFFPEPSAIAAGSELFADYLATAGVDPRQPGRLAGGPRAVVALITRWRRWKNWAGAAVGAPSSMSKNCDANSMSSPNTNAFSAGCSKCSRRPESWRKQAPISP